MLAARYKLPAVYYFKPFTEAGGLASYGVDLSSSTVARPAMSTASSRARKQSICLVINLKTAKALGLTVPDTLLARADEVIE